MSASPSIASLANKAGAPPLRPYLASRAELDVAPPADEAAVQRVLSINPSDLDALRRKATQLTERKKLKEATEAWQSITEITPLDGSAWAECGKSAYAAESFQEAETCLGHARELGVKDAAVLEIQARLRMKQNDFSGALAHIEEALTTNPNQQPLWLLRAECARALKQLPKETDSLERAAVLGELPAVWTKDLIGAYLEAGQTDKAISQLLKSEANLRTDSLGLMEYAAFWERAQRPKEAEGLWEKAIAADPKREAAYVGLVANYSAARRYADVATLTDRGLSFVPNSLPLLLAKEQSLERTGDIYGARRFLAGTASSDSLDLLKRRAALEDIYGGSASDAYLALLKALDSQNKPQAEVVEACRRGVLASLREEHPEAAKIFAEKLANAGDNTGLDLVTRRSAVSERLVEIPGGAEALEFLLLGHSNGKSRPDQILLTTANFLAKMNPNSVDQGEKAEWQHMVASFHEYFQRIASLNALGQRKAHAYEITLSVNDKSARQRTEKVFEILGLKMHRDKEGLSLQASEGKSQSKKQDVLAALAIDDQAIEEALNSAKTYTLEIPFDFAPIFPSEEFWRNGFFGKEKLPGGLAEAFVTDISLPRLYVALNSMDHAVAEGLARADSPKNLAERYSLSLWLYSAALAMNGGAAEVPGGDGARPIWSNLVAADPNSGVGFFEALLRKDDGRLISFFYALSQLDMEHQRFFTRSTERTKRFYDLFRNSVEMRKAVGSQFTEGGFLRFLREVPLNEDLSVDFPGSPEVWMVAKGLKSTTNSVAKMTRKMKRAAAPDDEDQILIRLATTEYKTNVGLAQSELSNFIVVARIDAQRTDPLTPESALLLAQGYVTHRGLYPYFIRLGDLETADYQKLLSLETKFDGLDLPTANMRLGELHAFLAIAGAVHDSAVHDGVPTLLQFLPMFRKSLGLFLAARDGAAFTDASLSFLSELVPYIKTANQSADEAIRNLLLGVAGPSREKAFDQVLSLQKIPSVDGLLSIERGLRKLTGPPAVFDDIQRELQKLTVLDVPKAWHLVEDRKKSLYFYDNSQALRIVNKMRLTASKHKKNEEEELEKMAAELRVAIEPWVELAMVGRVYARYLDGSDILVSEDPMLVRKHSFVDVGVHGGKPDWFASSDLFISSEAEGSYFVGGLAEFSVSAGKARASGNHLGGVAGEPFASALFTSVRATDWRGFTPGALSSFGAQCSSGSEWIVRGCGRSRDACGVGGCNPRHSFFVAPQNAAEGGRRARLELGVESRHS